MLIRLFLMTVALPAALVGCGLLDRERAPTGATLYAAHCAVCHGVDARGGGGGGVEGLSKTPPDLTQLASGNGGVFPANEVLAQLEGYAAGGVRGRQMSGMTALQSDDRKRARLEEDRIRTTAPLADLLVYLERKQRP